MVVIVSKQAVNEIGGELLTDTGYWMLDAGLLVAQSSEDVNVQDTRSPLLGMREYVLLLVPAKAPLTFHW